MVCQELQRHKEGKERPTPEPLATVAPDESNDRGGYEAECGQLPDVSRLYEDDEVARQGPHDRSQHGGQRVHLERTHEDIKAHEQRKDQPRIGA